MAILDSISDSIEKEDQEVCSYIILENLSGSERQCPELKDFFPRNFCREVVKKSKCFCLNLLSVVI